MQFLICPVYKIFALPQNICVCQVGSPHQKVYNSDVRRSETRGAVQFTRASQ